MTTQIDNETKEYELGFLVRDEQALSAIMSLMNRFGFTTTFQSDVKRIVLGYPIKKETAALFGYYHFIADPAMIKEFSHELRLTADVLRFIVVTDPIKREQFSGGSDYSRGSQPRKTEVADESAAVVTNEDLERTLEQILT